MYEHLYNSNQEVHKAKEQIKHLHLELNAEKRKKLEDLKNYVNAKDR
jgi:hypothetical protein